MNKQFLIKAAALTAFAALIGRKQIEPLIHHKTPQAPVSQASQKTPADLAREDQLIKEEFGKHDYEVVNRRPSDDFETLRSYNIKDRKDGHIYQAFAAVSISEGPAYELLKISDDQKISMIRGGLGGIKAHCDSGVADCSDRRNFTRHGIWEKYPDDTPALR